MDADGLTAEMLDRTSIKIPKFKEWTTRDAYDHEQQIVDYETLEDLNRAINQARLALFKTTESINNYERKEKAAKLNYERHHRREMLKSIAKTADARRARADIMCEELENEWLLQSQIKEELIRFSHTLRLELQTLQALGNNLRQQIRV